MALVTLDSMTGPNWGSLKNHTGEKGAVWTQHPAYPGTFYLFGNKTHPGLPGILYASGVPASADYTVECDYTKYSDASTTAICGRMSTTTLTYYYTYYTSAGELVLVASVAGLKTTLDADNSGLMVDGNTYHLELEMIGTAIKVYLDGIERCSAVDSSITAAGRAGVRSVSSADAGVGKHIDTFTVTDTSTPPVARSQVVGVIGL